MIKNVEIVSFYLYAMGNVHGMENVIYFMEANIIYVSVCKKHQTSLIIALKPTITKSQNLNYEIIPPLHLHIMQHLWFDVICSDLRHYCVYIIG